jgi:hypothetical protein
MDIPCIYLVDIHGISKGIPCIYSLMDINGISKDIPCIYHVYVEHLHICGIYQAYSRHIPKIWIPDVLLRTFLCCPDETQPTCHGCRNFSFTVTTSMKRINAQALYLSYLLCYHCLAGKACQCPTGDTFHQKVD